MQSRAKRNRNLLRWSLVGYAIAVLFLSLYPNPRELIPLQWQVTDALLHFAGYFLLGVLLALALPKASAGQLWRTWLITLAAVVVGALYGVAIEIGQAFTGRSPELRDAIANMLGVAAGAVGATAVRLIRTA
jgi:VanZ family protein